MKNTKVRIGCNGGVFIVAFEIYLTHRHVNDPLLSICPARLAAGFVVPRFTASALLGQGLRWTAALAGGLLLISVRVWLVRLAAEWGQPPAIASNSSIKKMSGWPLCR